MPHSTRSGKVDFTHRSNQYGRIGRQNIPGTKKRTSRKKKPVTPPTVQTRSSLKNQKLKTPPAPTLPHFSTPTTPVHVLPRVTRKSRPTCSHFGPMRRFLYPGYFFCRHCDWWDDMVASHLHDNCNREGNTYRCRASHTNTCIPTDTMYRHANDVDLDGT